MLHRFIAHLLSALVLLTGCAARAEQPTSQPIAHDTYANPLDVLVADPFIYREANTYFLYGTSADDGLLVWTSNNLVDWRLRGYAWKRTNQTWGRSYFWAPEMFKYKGKYYLHFTALGRHHERRIVLAEGDSPLGPFKEKLAPWWDPGNSVIDSDVFRDDDGKMYLYAVYTPDNFKGKFQVRVHTLDDQLRVSKESTLCITPEKPWEGGIVNEGPFVIKHNGYYLLTYSFNGYQDPNYSVGIAWAKSPLGPWNKTADGPILHRIEGVSGPGHHCFIDSPDHKEWFIAYHTHQFLDHPGGPRQLAIDRAQIIEGNPPTIKVFGPTITPQPMPSGSAPLVRGQNDEFSSTTLDRRRWNIFGEDPANWSLKDGRLVIRTFDGDVFEDRNDLENLFLEYAPFGDFDVTTRVAIQPKRDYQQAFLDIWQDQNDYAKIAIVWSHGGLKFEINTEVNEKNESDLHPATSASDYWLRIGKHGNEYAFSVSTDGTTWQKLGTRNLTLIDLRVGLGACSPDSDRSIPAAFDFVHIQK